VIPALVVVVLLAAPQPACEDLESCRALALEAHERADYEAFHDLAWAAYRKGKNNDVDLMLLVARAQSLSGRPGDALVMLERIAALGAPTGAATSDDFARVRALPRWPEVADRLSVEPAPPAKDPAPPKKDPAPPKKEPAAPAKDPAPPPKEPAPPKKNPTSPAKDPAHLSKTPARSAKDPLTFTTVLTPSALVYDAVSRRFIIADRLARRIAVVDEHTGQVATLVGAQGALGDIGGLAIDPQQGDLWVVTSTEDGAVLHHMQLISGRVLSTSELTGIEDPVVAMTFARKTGLVLADAKGTIWRVRPTGRTEKLSALEYVPLALAADPSGRLYVTAGAPRLARFTIGPGLRKIDVIDLEPGLPADAPFVVASGRLHFIVPVGGTFEIRSMAVR
jgi:hypothetical protein